MKKIWIALVSIFVLLGGITLSACGKKELSLSLSSQVEEICIDADKEEEVHVVTATVGGVEDGEVIAVPATSGIVDAVAVYNSTTKRNEITLTGISEGQTSVIVSCVDDPNIKNVISVTVYSDILGMEKKGADSYQEGENPFYAIRNGSVSLDWSDLIKFTNSTREDCRKDIVWSLEEGTAYATIEGNVLTVNSDYGADTINVIATSLHNPGIMTAPIELKVVDKIDTESIKITYSNSLNGAFVDITEEPIRIVPNADDDSCNAYVKLTFKGANSLDVQPVINGSVIEYTKDDGTVVSYQIIKADRVNKPAIENDNIVYTYKISALDVYVDKDGTLVHSPAINGDSKVKFNIKYSEFNYTVTSKEFNVASYEKIKYLNVYKGVNDASLTPQLVYTSYQNVYGDPYTIELLPTTVVNKTGKFTIKVEYPLSTDTTVNTLNENTLNFFYKSRLGNYIEIAMEKINDTTFKSGVDGVPLGVSQIYMVAGQAEVRTVIQGVKVTFTSIDNELANKTINMNLYRSATALEFEKEDELAVVAPTSANSPKTIIKTITLSGQTNIVGLHTKYDGEGFTVSDPVPESVVAGADGDSVTFDVVLTITQTGCTEKGSYYIYHDNGIESSKFSVELFLPLTDAKISYDEGTGNTSVNDYLYNNDLYVINSGALALVEEYQTMESLLSLFVKTNSSIQLNIQTNKAGLYYAVSQVSYRYLDLTADNADIFETMTADTIFADSVAVSSVLNIGRDNTLITEDKAGKTYIVAEFKGYDEEYKEITFVRIIKVETHVAIGIPRTTNTTATVYASDSVNSSELAKFDITIDLGDNLVNPITYCDFNNFVFTSLKYEESNEGKPISATPNMVVWEANNYSLSNVSIDGKRMTFTVIGNTTNGDSIFKDVLNIEYYLRRDLEDENSKVLLYRKVASINIEVKNADRVESIEWNNSTEDGLYFEVTEGANDSQTAVIVTTVSPTNAKDLSLEYIVTNEEGNKADFVKINEISKRGVVTLNATQGATGFIYILPKDSFNNEIISFFYKVAGDERIGTVAKDQIGQAKGNETWFDYLCENAYFKNNSGEEVSFSKILVRIPVTVADGRDWNTAYRLYNPADFVEMKSYRYYIVMNSVQLTSWDGIEEFTGGIRGNKEDITIQLLGTSAFVNKLTVNEETGKGGEIRDLKFTGLVFGTGMVANINEGTIENVSVDVLVYGNEVASSYVSLIPDESGVETYAGGLVGANYGTINNVQVLGTSVVGATYIGGIAGYNSGIISNAKFEIYSFYDSVEEIKYANTLSAQSYVAGLVGYADGGSISLSYAYDYTLEGENSGLNLEVQDTVNGKIATFIGYINKTTALSESFAVVNAQQEYGAIAVPVDAESTIKFNGEDYYYSYYSYDGEKYQYHTSYSDAKDSNKWLTPSEEGFLAYVNGAENQHLKNVYQTRALTQGEIDKADMVEVVKENKFNQTLPVSQANMIAFFYGVEDRVYEDMATAELNDLKNLNTIELSSLFGEENASIIDRLVVTSSDVNTIEVTNNALIIKRTGNVTLTISSKQNYALKKVVNVAVVYALSTVNASWTTGLASLELPNNSTVDLQRESSIAVSYGFDNSRIFLGNLGNSFAMLENKLSFDNEAVASNSNEEDNNKYNSVLNTSFGGNVLTIPTTASTYEINNIKTFVVLDCFKADVDDANYALYTSFNEAIKQRFNHNFTLQLFEGALKLAVSEQGLSITPSEVGVLTAELLTNNKNDDLTVEIAYKNGSETIVLDSAMIDNQSTNLVYSLNGQNRLIVSWSEDYRITDETTGKTTVKYNYNFSVEDSFKGEVASNQEYVVTMKSYSDVKAKSFILTVSKQEFTNIDINFYKTTGVYESANKRTVYTLGDSVSVIKPGDTALVAVSVNPTYAYYDYFSFTLSGSPNANAVSIAYMKKVGDKYVEGNFTTITGGVMVTEKPQGEENLSILVFKVWINPNVQQDANLKFTINFYDNSSEEAFEYAHDFLSISYLAEPEVRVNGATEDAVIARGTVATVEVEVNYDQTIDLDTAALRNVESGIYLSSNWEESINAEGRRVFKTTLSADVKASLRAEAKEFYVYVKVSRMINGVQEVKEVEVNVKLVNFTIDAEDVNIFGENGDSFTAYVGVSKPLVFNYNIYPTAYNYDSSNSDSVAKVNYLNELRNNFNNTGYYEELINSDIIDGQKNYNFYSINYQYNDANEIEANKRKVPAYERISYWSELSNGWVPIYNKTTQEFNDAGGSFSFEIDVNEELIVTGLKLSSETTRFRLTTLIQNGAGSQNIAEKYYYFTMGCDAYSSEDLPLCVWDETDFADMQTGTPQDYILMNDIVLTNHTAFSTDSIRSLDGNGFTIYLNSFDIEPSGENLKLALFDTVQEETTLKNIRVNIYNGGQIIADISKYKQVDIAGFALSNEGIITNCEVVAFYDMTKSSSHLTSDIGLNVKYVNGKGNSTESFMNDSDSSFNSSVAGFVINNTGNITNSRVGGQEIITIKKSTSEKEVNTSSIVEGVYQSLEVFNINAQGNIAGFVLENSNGVISSSYVKRVGMANKSNSTNRYIAGFVGNNSGKIISSYVEGAEGENATDIFCKQGTCLTSKLGVIAGFVHTNSNVINDCYSNILISNNRAENYIYLASGFVYINEANAVVENCYSASQVTASKYSQMNFTGISIDGAIQNYAGTTGFINNYYYNSSVYGSVSSTEDKFKTGATQQIDVSNENHFYGFAFANNLNSNDGVWVMTVEGPKLVEANIIAVSNRRYNVVNDDTSSSNTSASNKKYNLPYTTVKVADTLIDTNYGSVYNPIIIRTAQEFDKVMGNGTDSDITKHYDQHQISGSYRLVDDINLSELLTTSGDTTFKLKSSKYAFTGILMGNGFNIQNLAISSQDKMFAYGLFASVENAVLVNFNITVNQVTNNQAATVGALAGLVRNAKVVNIKITNGEGSKIEGGNFVGGLVGMVYGDSFIKNISISDANIISDRFINTASEEQSVYNENTAQNLRVSYESFVGTDTVISAISQDNVNRLFNVVSNYSYAGGLIGHADIFRDGKNTGYVYSDKRTLKDYDITTLRATGTLNVQGQVVGGLVGYQGRETYIMDGGVTIDATNDERTSHLVATKFYAGGVIGQANSAMSQLFAVHDITTQHTIENNIDDYYLGNTEAERGITDLFDTNNIEETYTREAIGGLVGYATGGTLTMSYSKLNVTSNNTNFAGGIIGKLNTRGLDQYTFNNGSQDYQANFLIHEVYATGDVRARYDAEDNTKSGQAGGILGFIAQGSKVSLMTVNAMNMFSIQNYATGNLYTEANLRPQTETSFANINVYSIAGYIEGTINNEGNLQTGVLNNTLAFVRVAKANSQEEGYSEFASVGFVYSYEGISGFVNNTTAPAYPKYPANNTENDKFRIPRYTTLENIEEGGYQTTFGYFLGSGLWSTDNWKHETTDLYPSIRYTVAEEAYIYLDAYDESIKEVFETMATSQHVEVRVRGYESANSTRIVDIDISNYLQRNPLTIGATADGLMLQSFAGRLVYKSEYGVKSEDGQPPRLIISNPLFEQGGEGVSIENVDFQLKDPGAISSKRGFFTQETNFTGAIFDKNIVSGNMVGLDIFVENPIYLKTTTVDSSNTNSISATGLLAPTASNTNITDVKIINNLKSKDAPLLSIVTKDVSNLDAGLIVGTVTQNSAEEESVIKGCLVENLISGTLINFISGNEVSTIHTKISNTANIGTFFGHLQREEKTIEGKTTLSISYDLGEITYYPESLSEVPNNINLINVDFGNLNIGGNVGKITNITVSGEKKLKLNLGIDINTNISGLLNAGLVFGDVNTNLIRYKFLDSEIKGYIKAGSSYNLTGAENNIGGLIGKAKALDISNVNVDVEIYESPANSPSWANRYKVFEENFINMTDDNYNAMPFSPIKMTGITNVGGLIGQATEFNYDGSTTISNPNVINETYAPIAIWAEKVNIGGMIGLITGQSTTISNAIKSNATLYAKDNSTDNSNNISVGGLVGNNNSSSSVSEIKVLSLNAETSENISILVNSQIYTSGNAIVGGIVGQSNAVKDDNSGYVGTKIVGTSFAGAYRILGGNAITFGGTLGTNTSGTSIINAGNIILNKNVNYGDVFNVNNKTFNNFTFGGIAGSVGNDESSSAELRNNYSLVTNHNVTKPKNDFYIKALVGTGAVDTRYIGENHYNHAVSMAIDDQGYDTAYATPYGSESYKGYSSKKDMALIMIGEMNDRLEEILGDSLEAGAKLKPIDLKANEINSEKIVEVEEGLNDYYTTNGIKYYVLKSDNLVLEDGVSLFTTDEQNLKELNNIAIIGDSNTLTYTSIVEYSEIDTTNINKGAQIESLIAVMNRNSFISGLNVEVNIESETLQTFVKSPSPVIGGLVDNLNSGKIYSVGVTGTMSFGGVNHATIGGIVGSVGGASIEESNASVNIIYRGPTKTASTTSVISGLAGKAEEAWINNCYTSNILTTYTTADLYALGKATTDTLLDNSYSIARMNVSDVTLSSDPVHSTEKCSCYECCKNIYGSATINNVYYSQATSEYAGKPNEEETGTTKVDNINSKIADLSNIAYDWEQVFDLNYNYAVRQNHYTQPTSYYVRTDDMLEYKQDRGVARYVYQRVPVRVLNKETTTTSDTTGTTNKDSSYYGVLNAQKLAEIKDSVGSHTTIVGNGDAKFNKFVILDDIDMAKAYGDSNWTSISATNSMEIDGNGKAIKNLNNPLFSTLGTGTTKTNTIIENLRLVSVHIPQSGSVGSFANEINGTTLNYITTQGSIDSSGTGDLGGFVGKATSSTIKNSSNMVSLTTGSATKDSIGGLVGYAISVDITYSNNNATIIGNTDDAGGLVGVLNSSTISNSYNTAGLVINYTQNLTGDKNMRIGGIAGGMDGVAPKIENCYNTGLVKAGKKEFVNVAYVGGIVGNATAGTVSRCLNEGSVEGRAETSWYFEDSGNDVYLKQGERHLYVYGIGHSSGATISNVKVVDEVQIVADGNGLENNEEMYSWTKSTQTNTNDKTSSNSSNMGFGKYERRVNRGKIGSDDIECYFIQYHNIGYKDLAGNVTTYTGDNTTVSKENENALVSGDNLIPQILSYDNYGFPKAISFPYYSYSKIDLQDAVYAGGTLAAIAYGQFCAAIAMCKIPVVGWIVGPAAMAAALIEMKIAENIYDNADTDATRDGIGGFYNWTISGASEDCTYAALLENQGIVANDFTNNGLSKDTNSFKSEITGTGTSYTGASQLSDYTDMYIGGNLYYVALGDEQSIYNTFNNGVTIATVSKTFEAGTLTDFGAANYYNVKYVGTDETKQKAIISSKVSGYSKDVSGNITLTFDVYISDEVKVEWATNEDFEVSYNYISPPQSINFANATYVYNIDSGLIKINMPNGYAPPENQEVTTVTSEDKVDEEDSSTSIAGDLVKIRDNSNNEYYLIYDKESNTYYYTLCNIYNSNGIELTNINAEKDALMPDYFAGNTFSVYTTTITAGVSTSLDLSTANNTNYKGNASLSAPSDETTSGSISLNSVAFSQASNINVNLTYDLTSQDFYKYSTASQSYTLLEEYGNSITEELSEDALTAVELLAIESLTEGASTTDWLNGESVDHVIAIEGNNIATATYIRQTRITKVEIETQPSEGEGDETTPVEPVISYVYTREEKFIFNSLVIDDESVNIPVGEPAVNSIASFEVTDNNITINLTFAEALAVSDSNKELIKTLLNSMTISNADITLNKGSESINEILNYTEYYYKNINYSYNLPTIYKAGVVNGNTLLAKFTGANGDVWKIGNTVDNITIDGVTYSVQINNDKLIFKLEDYTGQDNSYTNTIVGFESVIENNVQLVQQVRNWTYENNYTISNDLNIGASKEVSKGNGQLNFVYLENYKYRYNSVQGSASGPVNINVSQTETESIFTIELNETTLGANDSFTLLQGDFAGYSANVTYTKATSFKDLAITLYRGSSSTYSLLTWSVDVDGIEKVATENTEITSDQMYNHAEEFSSVSVEYEIYNSYVTLNVKNDIEDSNGIWEYSYESILNHGGVKYSFDYDDESKPILTSGTLYNGSVEYDVNYETDGSIKEISWYSSYINNGAEHKDLILSYKDGKYYSYSDIYLAESQELLQTTQLQIKESKKATIRSAVTLSKEPTTFYKVEKEVVEDADGTSQFKISSITTIDNVTEKEKTIYLVEGTGVFADGEVPEGYSVMEDENGNYIYAPEVDENGNPVIDGNGNVVYSSKKYYEKLTELTVTAYVGSDGKMYGYNMPISYDENYNPTAYGYYMLDCAPLYNTSVQVEFSRDNMVLYDSKYNEFAFSELKKVLDLSYKTTTIKEGEETKSYRVYLDNNQRATSATTIETEKTSNWEKSTALPVLSNHSSTFAYDIANIYIYNPNYSTTEIVNSNLTGHYNQGSKTISFDYKVESYRDALKGYSSLNIKSGASGQTTISEKLIFASEEEKKSYSGIILAKNITFAQNRNFVGVQINISGNEYLINSSLTSANSFIEQVAEGIYIKNIILVSQINASNLEAAKDVSVVNNKGTLSNWAIYGNIRNIANVNASVSIIRNSALISNIVSNITINGLNADRLVYNSQDRSGNGIFYNIVSIENGSNKQTDYSNCKLTGIIIAGNGSEGIDGKTKYYTYSETNLKGAVADDDNEGKGGNGGAGGSITYIETNTNAYIQAGKGGNGGAGGNGSRGADLFELSDTMLGQYLSSSPSSSDRSGGAGGSAGVGGTAGGVNSIVEEKLSGQSGQAGKAGRDGVGGAYSTGNEKDYANIVVINRGKVSCFDFETDITALKDKWSAMTFKVYSVTDNKISNS